MQSTRYTRTAMLLHWLIALLMIINVSLIWCVDSLPEAWGRPVIDTHKSFGILVLGLFFLRLTWRVANPPPALPAAYKAYERHGSHWVQIAFYVLMFALPMSGWLHDSAWKAAATHPMQLFGLVPWPRIGWVMSQEPVFKEQLHGLFGAVHTALAYLLYVLVVLHVGGAIKHELKDKDSALQRIWPWPLPWRRSR